MLFWQVFERHSEILQHLILVSIEGHVRDWGWNSVNSISTPYFGAVHWHRGRRRQKTSIGEIIARKTKFALFSAKVRHYDGDFLTDLCSCVPYFKVSILNVIYLIVALLHSFQ